MGNLQSKMPSYNLSSAIQKTLIHQNSLNPKVDKEAFDFFMKIKPDLDTCIIKNTFYREDWSIINKIKPYCKGTCILSTKIPDKDEKFNIFLKNHIRKYILDNGYVTSESFYRNIGVDLKENKINID